MTIEQKKAKESQNQRMEGERKVVCCVLCGEPIGWKESFYRIHGFPYCETCLDFSDIETIVRICEMPKREWLEQMGFTFVRGQDVGGEEN